jgi:predicted PurR-regulated permease PerM
LHPTSYPTGSRSKCLTNTSKPEISVTLAEIELPPEEKRAVAVRGHMLFAVGIFLLLALCYKIARELEIIYVSALFAVVLMPAVRRITTLNLRGYRPSNAVAIILLLFTAAVAFGIFFSLGLPPVLRDLRHFLVDAPKQIPNAVSRLHKLPIADDLKLDELAAKAENLAAALGAYVVNAIPGWLSHIFDILTTVFLTIYFILEGDHAYHFFLSLFPASGRRRLDITLRKAEVQMSKWLFGQGLLMLTMGVTFTIAFAILHLRYFLLLGVLMGLFNIIPIAGAAITVSLALIVASLDSWTKVLAVVIIYAIYVNLENAVLTPRIMKSSVNLMGLTVLVALLIGTALAGIVGALVAVPTAALVAVLLEEYAVQR